MKINELLKEVRQELATMLMDGTLHPAKVEKTDYFKDSVYHAEYNVDGVRLSLGAWSHRNDVIHYSTSTISVEGFLTPNEEARLRASIIETYESRRRERLLAEKAELQKRADEINAELKEA